MLVVLDGDVPARLTLDNLIFHTVYGEVDDIVLDGHLIACALVASDGVALVYCYVIEATAVDAIHRIVFPYEMCGVWLAGKVAQPRCSGRVVNAVTSARDQSHVVAIFSRVTALEAVEELTSACCEKVAGKHKVIGSGKQ